MQVLFAFLLIVPFDSGFAHVGNFERTIYFIALIFAALAAVCTIAPSAHHRFLFRQDDKKHLVFMSNHIVIVGLAFLALSNLSVSGLSCRSCEAAERAVSTDFGHFSRRCDVEKASGPNGGDRRSLLSL